ncbi:hypothetical protein [uncultured Shewanella sp.]|uniref:hypothetical protein n=1 Tax=uncultured Shewanella sp. TaxID=173975 RepID=UPI002603663D|nr:hypothetical protein [uncultured Shewanella sp.]
MNEFAVKIKTCDLIYDEQSVVTQSDINRVIVASNFEQSAKDRVAKLIVKAKAKIEEAQLAASNIIEEAKCEAIALTEQWKQEAKQDAINEALHWHCQQHEFESEILAQLKGRIRQQMTDVISQWGAEQPPSNLLIHRLSALVTKEAEKSALTLMVSSSEYQTISDAFAETLTVEIDDDMQPWEAQLSSSCLSIRLNLKEHLEALLAVFQPVEAGKQDKSMPEVQAEHTQDREESTLDVNEERIEEEEYHEPAFLMQEQA